MTRQRSDPFGCPNKARSRELIWSCLAQFKPPQAASTLILTGPKRYELDLLLQKRFDQNRIYLVEENVATFANFIRQCRDRPTPPRVNMLRMKLSQAAAVLLERGITIDLAHLDFCTTCVRKETIAEIQAFVRSGVMADPGVLAVSVLRGREPDLEDLSDSGEFFSVKTMTTSLSAQDRGRVRKIYEAIGLDVELVQFGQYYNTRTRNPMQWIICKITASSARPKIIGKESDGVYASITRRWTVHQEKTTR